MGRNKIKSQNYFNKKIIELLSKLPKGIVSKIFIIDLKINIFICFSIWYNISSKCIIDIYIITHIRFNLWIIFSKWIINHSSNNRGKSQIFIIFLRSYKGLGFFPYIYISQLIFEHYYPLFYKKDYFGQMCHLNS